MFAHASWYDSVPVALHTRAMSQKLYALNKGEAVQVVHGLGHVHGYLPSLDPRHHNAVLIVEQVERSTAVAVLHDNVEGRPRDGDAVEGNQVAVLNLVQYLQLPRQVNPALFGHRRRVAVHLLHCHHLAPEHAPVDQGRRALADQLESLDVGEVQYGRNLLGHRAPRLLVLLGRVVLACACAAG